MTKFENETLDRLLRMKRAELEKVLDEDEENEAILKILNLLTDATHLLSAYEVFARRKA